ncbi:MAG: hypothetical protein V1722_05405 [Candidatus Micrarchaeota archaeon]
MKESYSVMPSEGFILSVGKFTATIAIGKKTTDKTKTEIDVAHVSVFIPELYKAKVFHKGKRKVKFERSLAITVPVSKAYKKDFINCFKALEKSLGKAKPKIKMLPN